MPVKRFVVPDGPPVPKPACPREGKSPDNLHFVQWDWVEGAEEDHWRCSCGEQNIWSPKRKVRFPRDKHDEGWKPGDP